MEPREIFEKTLELLDSTADRVPAQDVKSSREDLSAGELGLAIDTIVYALLEDEIPLSRQEYDLVSEILGAFDPSIDIRAVRQRDEILDLASGRVH